ncbi:MAG: PAS domain S-box protein [Chloroflexi bacterium]|nr:PAS domain S-box protein [Chloroflexota bacterium]
MSSEGDLLRLALEETRRELLAAQSRADHAEAKLSATLADAALPTKFSIYASLFDALIEGCQIIAYDWRYLYLNDMAARHARRDKQELIGRTMPDVYPGIEATPLFTLLERCMIERQAQNSVHEFKYPDGERAWFELRVQPIPEGILALTHDITERKRSEESLRDSEERFRLLVDQVEDYAIYMLDAQGNVASWNQGAEKLKGYAADAIIGRHFSIFFTPEDRDAQKPALLLERARRDRHTEDDGWRVRQDGSRFWASAVITALYNDGRTLIGFTKIIRDQTERRLAEAALREQQEWLAISMDASDLGTWRHDIRAGVIHLDERAAALWLFE